MIKNIILSVLSVVIGLILVELILTSLNLPKFYNSHRTFPPNRFVGDPIWIPGPDGDSIKDYLYINTPSSNIEFVYDGNPRQYFDIHNAVYHKTNSMGFRGAEFKTEKDSNTFRIAFIGDSFTFGDGVKDEDTFAEKVKDKLKKKHNNLNFESYNFGIGAYNTEQELFLLKKVALRYKPDAIVLQYNLNDAQPKLYYYEKLSDTTLTSRQKERESKSLDMLPDNHPSDAFIFKLRTSKLIWKIFNDKQRSSKLIKYYTEMYEESNPDWQTTQNSLKEFLKVCTDNKIDCYVIVFPLLYNLNNDYPFLGIHSKIENIVKNNSSEFITYIDLFPYFKGRKDSEMWVHPTDQHPNEIAHEIIGKCISEHMKMRTL